MRPTEKNTAAHHSHRRTVAENVFGILGVKSANHGHAASHEFGEIITGGTQHPKLGRLEAGIVFGHGHAPGADVAGNVDFSLGHAIGRAVGRMTMHRDGRAGVEPAHVVRGRTEHVDKGIGVPQGADPLTGLAFNGDVNRLAMGFPKAATDTVLAKGWMVN